MSDHESDRVNLRLDDTLGNEKNGKLKNNSTNQTLRKLSCSNNSIYNCSNNHTTCQYDGINRSATTNDVHFLIREEQDSNNKKVVDDENITAKTPFLSDANNPKPTKDTSTEIRDEGERKGVNFGTTATVLVATTKLKSCLKNPLRKKKKHSEADIDGTKKLKKKQSKKHICWENENLIQNEEDGRGMQSKILNMAIVASGPAFLHGGGLNPESRRSSNPEAPLITDSSMTLDFNPNGRKGSLLVDSLNAISRTSSTSTLKSSNSRRRSSVMVTSLVKSLDKLGKYRPTFKASSDKSKPSQLHNIMASASIYNPTTKVLTTTTISDATNSAPIDTTAHSLTSQAASASNPTFACHSNRSNTKVIGHVGGGIDEIVHDIIPEVIDSPALSLKSCPASVPRRRKSVRKNSHTDHRHDKRRPSIHDEVAKARGKGILSPRFAPRSRHNGIGKSADFHERMLKKRSPKRARSRRNSIRNASQTNLKSICT